MSHKLVSVIIPTYNRARSVSAAIRSVQAQTYPAVQLIVADDGSADDTAEIIKEFENVEYYHQENGGQASARNLGLKHARGEYIASLDSDDIWHEDFLKVAVNALERFEADFVFLNWTEVSDTDQIASGWERSREWEKYAGKTRGKQDEWVFLDAAQVRELFVKTCPAPSSALLIKRSSLVSNWNTKMKIADDWYLILEMVLSKPCRAAFTLTSYWLKHVHSSNIYHGREYLEVLDELGLHDEPIFASDFGDLLTRTEKMVLKNRLGIHHFNFGRLNWRRDGVSKQALQSIAVAFRTAPLGSLSFMAQMSYDHLKYRFGLTKPAKKPPSETPEETQNQ